ncbi:MAG: hypothetical protein ABGZ53_29915, partial [Fuerstiella sp.]
NETSAAVDYMMIDTGTAANSVIGNAPITVNVLNNATPPAAVVNPNGYIAFQATAFSGPGDNGLYAVGNRSDRTIPDPATQNVAADYTTNILYNFNSATGAVNGTNRTTPASANLGAGTTQPDVGQINTFAGAGSGGTVTGAAFIGGPITMYVVTDNGELFTVNASNAATTFRARLTSFNFVGGTFDPIVGQTFAGLSAGPANVEGRSFANLLFAVTTSGRLYAFNTSGQAQPIFVDAADFVNVGSTAVTGLAFGTLDKNLWHRTTTERTADSEEHGVYPAFDNSTIRQTGVNNSLYFGFDGGGSRSNGNKNGWSTTEVNNVNFPGGAHGSVVSSEFSLEDYSEADKPALYFDYFLATEGADYDYGPSPDDLMRDSFRVFVGGQDGEWHLVVTNNTTEDSIQHDEYDWGRFDTTADNSTAQPGAQPFPDVVEAFDNTGTWRQAKVDLSNFAGEANLRLRFDFSTAGSMSIGDDAAFEIYALGAPDLSDGDQFRIDGTTFEFEMGTHMTVPSGAAAMDESFDLLGKTFTYVSTAPVNQNEIKIQTTFTAEQVAQATVIAVNAHTGLGGISISLGGINPVTSEGESFTIRGTTFTFTQAPVLTTDIRLNTGEANTMLTERAVTIINNELGGIAYQNGTFIQLQTTSAMDSTGGTLDLSGTVAVSDLELHSFTVRGKTFTFTDSPVVAPVLAATVADIDISGGITLAVATQRAIAAINTVFPAGTALDHDTDVPNRISIPDLPSVSDAFMKGGTIVLPSGAVGTTLEGESFTYNGTTFTFTSGVPKSANDIAAAIGDTGADVAALVEARIDFLFGATEAFIDAAAPNRVSIPNVIGASITVGGSLTVMDGASVNFMEFQVLGQAFRYSTTDPTGNGVINVSGASGATAADVASTTVTAVNNLLPGTNASANGDRVSFPDLPLATDGLYLG